jgi:hypothetical protein
MQLGVEHLDLFAGLAETFVWVEENGANHRGTSERLSAQHLGKLCFF